MIKKTPSESKIHNTGKETIETNQKKKEPGVSAIGQGPSLLKKNEFTMIIIAALAVTVLVFFFFFRGSSKQNSSKSVAVSAKERDQVAPGFEDRISALEISLAKIASASGQNENQAALRAVSDLNERITRVETAVNLKLDTLIERVGKLEGRLNKLAVAASTPPPKPVVKPKPETKKPAAPATPPVPEKKVQVVKKKAKTSKPKKTSQFHTVQKGETLWSISQKYKTNVAAIRRLNNLTPEDKIYVGTNLLVK
ncbi:LysM domain-containing protein [uncultured Desulfobacter sp.]|uniref:LysM peptidoglycan-binding domain-containing protein n=1 Tax=uncultured Desulfobacter sp. TaxID=240139 RepID=UPI0029F4E25B|nr:LysM domain-containing protein [uncultured Desulfobacter sp.]